MKPLSFYIEHKGKDYEVLIDESDQWEVLQKEWYILQDNYRNKRPHVVTAEYTNGKTKTIRMARFILNAPSNKEVDHINGNTLDNRRENLRLVTRQQNAQNIHVIKGKSGIRGVRKTKYAWQARVESKGKTIFSKNFKTKEEAEKAVIEARKRLFPYSNEVEV